MPFEFLFFETDFHFGRECFHVTSIIENGAENKYYISKRQCKIKDVSILSKKIKMYLP